MSKEKIDILLVIIQILTLIFLIIYVIKTWHIASANRESAEISKMILLEMKEVREAESAPYVVVYFELPYGEHVIHLIIKNIGKTSALDVRLAFDPTIRNSVLPTGFLK